MKQYDLITATSMGLRLCPMDRQPVGAGNLYQLHATSAESNVLNIAASLGMRTKVLTAFVKDSPMAAFIKGELGRRGIAYEGPDIDAGGPWGHRHQINIADSGFGVRGPRVHNDRAGEVGLLLSEEHFDLERVFQKEGARMIHFSGLFAALSQNTAAFCLRLAEMARDSGTLISFDLNHRASFWAGREAELRDAFHRIADMSDILIGNEEDYQLALGIQGPEAGGQDIPQQIAAFKGMIDLARKRYPRARVFANTLREVKSANAHLWGAILYQDGAWHEALPREIPILDRIGGGDAFVGGLLYGLLNNWPGERCLPFAWATGALATTLLTDYASPVSEQQVLDIWEGNARVQR